MQHWCNAVCTLLHLRVTLVSCTQMMSAFRDFNLSFRSPLRERRPLMFHERILILKHFTEFSLEFSYTYYPVCVLFCYGRNLLNNMLATSHIVGIWEITVA